MARHPLWDRACPHVEPQVLRLFGEDCQPAGTFGAFLGIFLHGVPLCASLHFGEQPQPIPGWKLSWYAVPPF